VGGLVTFDLQGLVLHQIGRSDASYLQCAYLIWIVLQYLFDSVMDISVLPCGHTMHRACLRQMTLHSQYALNLSNHILVSIVFSSIDFVGTDKEQYQKK